MNHILSQSHQMAIKDFFFLKKAKSKRKRRLKEKTMKIKFWKQ